MKRISLSNREKLLVSVLAVAVMIYLYLNYLLFPSYERVNELKSELQQKKLIAVNKDAAEKKLSALDNLLEDEQLQFEALEKKMPYNVRLPELVVNIDKKVKDLGMEIKSISIGDVDQANKDYGIIPVNVTLEGKYDSVLEFIKYIEDNERKYVVDNFVLSPVKRAEPMPFSISMRTFVLKDSEKTIRPEPEDYPFFKHENGKSYPFLENKEVPVGENNSTDEEIENMQKNYEKIDDIIEGINQIKPLIKGSGEGN
jgi:Tfp pilus assembly protein PilO